MQEAPGSTSAFKIAVLSLSVPALLWHLVSQVSAQGQRRAEEGMAGLTDHGCTL